MLEFYGTVGVPALYGVGLYLMTIQDIDFGRVVQVVGLISVGLGLWLWIMSFRVLGRSFGVLPRKQVRVTKGIYAYLTHPMYVGIFLTYLGLSASSGSTYGVIFTTLILLPLLTVRAYWENKLLT